MRCQCFSFQSHPLASVWPGAHVPHKVLVCPGPVIVSFSSISYRLGYRLVQYRWILFGFSGVELSLVYFSSLWLPCCVCDFMLCWFAEPWCRTVSSSCLLLALKVYNELAFWRCSICQRFSSAFHRFWLPVVSRFNLCGHFTVSVSSSWLPACVTAVSCLNLCGHFMVSINVSSSCGCISP